MTALEQMAAARPPGIADARVPCPLCGGLIHPVAGRCKHCKEDLTTFRAGRPQAAAALPALNGKPAPSTTNGTNGHAVAVPAVPVVVATAHEGSQPILPPRTTARSVQAQRPHSLWRSWPMLVIVLAVIAIVAATVIMIMPPGTKKHDGKMSAPPAPERMETNPLPDKSSQLDPWDNGVPGGAPGAVPTPAPVQPQAPAPADPDDDLWGGTGSGGLGGGGVLGGGGLGGGALGTPFMLTVIDHACKKLKTCPDVDQSTLTAICDSVTQMHPGGAPPGCAAAQKCLDAIDHLSCSQAHDTSPVAVFSLFQDCSDAANC